MKTIENSQSDQEWGAVVDLLGNTNTESPEQTSNNDIESFDRKSEHRWTSYLRAMVFVLPAMVAWGIACAVVIPGFEEYFAVTGLEPAPGGWFSAAPAFLLQFGPSMCVALILSLAVLEVFVPGWARYREIAVRVFVGVVNFAVAFGFMTLHSWAAV